MTISFFSFPLLLFSYPTLFQSLIYKFIRANMSVSSLFLRSGIASLAVLSSLSTPVLAAYQLDTEYSGSSFFDGFDFNTVDGSNGFVTYVYFDLQASYFH